MGDVAHVLTVVFPVLTIIIGAACALQYSIVATLRASNTDLRERVKELEEKDKRAEVKIAAQAVEIGLWQKTVTGEVHLVAITDLLEHHHAESVRIWADVQTTLTHVDQAISALAKGQP